MKRQSLPGKAAMSCCLGLAISLATGAASAREQIRIVGSSTVYPFATVVAEELSRKGYRAPVIESTGTGGGMKLFCAGIGVQHPDVTNASRAMKESEWKMCQENGVTDIIEIVVGNDGIAFANSVNGPLVDFTPQQIWMAMAEKGPKPEKWSDIDASLPDSKIEILTPPPTSGTRDAWNSLVMGAGCDAEVKAANKKDCALMREDGAVVEAGENDTLMVQKLGANPNAFAIFGYSYLDSNLDQIQAATINGVEISLDSIQSYDYPVSRPLFFYVKKAHVGVVPGIQEYMQEFTSEDAVGEEGYLADIGLVPLDGDKLAKIVDAADNLITMKQ
ncbi:MAG: substrate-binding domain-containing protein [Pseudomonadota bacterium]